MKSLIPWCYQLYDESGAESEQLFSVRLEYCELNGMELDV